MRRSDFLFKTFLPFHVNLISSPFVQAAVEREMFPGQLNVSGPSSALGVGQVRPTATTTPAEHTH